jgi:hypothetical protein
MANVGRFVIESSEDCVGLLGVYFFDSPLLSCCKDNEVNAVSDSSSDYLHHKPLCFQCLCIESQNLASYLAFLALFGLIPVHSSITILAVILQTEISLKKLLVSSVLPTYSAGIRGIILTLGEHSISS